MSGEGGSKALDCQVSVILPTWQEVSATFYKSGGGGSGYLDIHWLWEGGGVKIL